MAAHGDAGRTSREAVALDPILFFALASAAAAYCQHGAKRQTHTTRGTAPAARPPRTGGSEHHLRGANRLRARRFLRPDAGVALVANRRRRYGTNRPAHQNDRRYERRRSHLKGGTGGRPLPATREPLAVRTHQCLSRPAGRLEAPVRSRFAHAASRSAAAPKSGRTT